MSYIKGSPSHWTDDMTDTVTIYKAGALDSYGKRTVSQTGTVYRCRLISDVVKTNTDQNRIVVEEGRLIILDNPDVGIGDTLNLGTGFNAIITRVDKKTYNANGATTPHHAVISFGRS